MSESDNNGSGIEDTGDSGHDAGASDAAPQSEVVEAPAAAPQTFDADPGGKGDDIPSGPDAGSELHEEEDTRGDVPDAARHAAETATRGAAETGGPEAKAAGDDKGGKDTGAEAKDDAPEADAAPAPGTTGSSGTLNHGDEVSIDHDVRPGSSDDHGPAAATAGSGGETAGSGTAATTAETDDHGPAEPASEPADTGRPEAANKEPAAEDATTGGTEAAGDAADATAGGGTETGGPEADDHDDGTPGADGRDDAPADHEQVEDEDGAGGSEAGGVAGDDTEADTDAEPADDAGSGEAAGGEQDNGGGGAEADRPQEDDHDAGTTGPGTEDGRTEEDGDEGVVEEDIIGGGDAADLDRIEEALSRTDIQTDLTRDDADESWTRGMDAAGPGSDSSVPEFRGGAAGAFYDPETAGPGDGFMDIHGVYHPSIETVAPAGGYLDDPGTGSGSRPVEDVQPTGNYLTDPFTPTGDTDAADAGGEVAAEPATLTPVPDTEFDPIPDAVDNAIGAAQEESEEFDMFGDADDEEVSHSRDEIIREYEQVKDFARDWEENGGNIRTELAKHDVRFSNARWDNLMGGVRTINNIDSYTPGDAPSTYPQMREIMNIARALRESGMDVPTVSPSLQRALGVISYQMETDDDPQLWPIRPTHE